MSESYEFTITANALAERLQEMDEQDAVVVPLLDEASCERFVLDSEALAYRPAKPVIGEGEKAVYQDFLLTVADSDIPVGQPFTRPFGPAVDLFTQTGLPGEIETVRGIYSRGS